MDAFCSAMLGWMWTKHGGSAINLAQAPPFKECSEPAQKGTALKAAQKKTEGDAAVKNEDAANRQRVSVADVLKREGIFTQAELDRLEYILNAGNGLKSP